MASNCQGLTAGRQCWRVLIQGQKASGFSFLRAYPSQQQSRVTLAVEQPWSAERFNAVVETGEL
jgi:hypothetical protein